MSVELFIDYNLLLYLYKSFFYLNSLLLNLSVLSFENYPLSPAPLTLCGNTVYALIGVTIAAV
jgi:hypothetical protein